jgi:putative lipase involved disintegration of autophagic bodies
MILFHKDYRLVITGHSLGAGTAAILATLLKRKYRDVQCFAFSPPGGLMRSVCTLLESCYKSYSQAEI